MWAGLVIGYAEAQRSLVLVEYAYARQSISCCVRGDRDKDQGEAHQSMQQGEKKIRDESENQLRVE